MENAAVPQQRNAEKGRLRSGWKRDKERGRGERGWEKRHGASACVGGLVLSREFVVREEKRLIGPCA